MVAEKIGVIDGQILTIVNGDLGDADTSYTYINMLAEDCRYAVIDFTIQNTTLTLEATNDATSVADASANWTDITTYVSGAANATASGAWILDAPLSYRRIRIKRVTTNATNALSIRVSRSK